MKSYNNIISGFLVFLLALPLSLGIAKASGYPAAMGVLTAMIGGLFTTLFKVSPLTIKGPAAGLITICSAAVIEFGGSETGWKVASAALVIAAIFQILMAVFKFGTLSDFFPHSAVHGMLAAIGIIIIAKQIPVLLGDEPELFVGETPVELILDIPFFIQHAHIHIAIVGLIAMAIMFSHPRINNSFIKKFPAPIVVLLVSIPLSLYWHFKETEPAYSLVQIGNFWNSIGLNADFSFIGSFAFWKYVLMFLFVNSLESLLTVKATDQLNPNKDQVSDYNGDLMGLGAGNFLSGILGGLPMISEVVRSSANIGFGATNKFSNFFHGIFLLIAMIFLIPVIEMIPNAALAAMLIYAGYRLAAPSQFLHTLHIGKEQLAIFIITIVVTLLEDLLLGILAGILVKLLYHIYHGAKIKSLFKPFYEIEENASQVIVHLKESALFSNLIGFKKMLNHLNTEKEIVIELRNTNLVDHSFMAFITYYQSDFIRKGGRFEITGLQNHRKFSDHPLATHKNMG